MANIMNLSVDPGYIALLNRKYLNGKGVEVKIFILF
jgi:hypothetical protein